MVRRNETRPRKQVRATSKPGHREVRLQGTQTLWAWVETPTGREMVVVSVPAGLTATRMVVSHTPGMKWKIGPPPMDDLHE